MITNKLDNIERYKIKDIIRYLYNDNDYIYIMHWLYHNSIINNKP